MKKLTLIVCVFMLTFQIVNAQTKQITGKVTSSEDGLGIPGVSVLVKGTTMGTTTNIDGEYDFSVTDDAKILIFSFVGMKTQEVVIAGRSSIFVVLEPEAIGMDEVVVTALGITREKKSLGYATQEVKGEDLAVVKSDNFVNALSGKAAGVQVRRTNNMGGSTNIVIRGSTSLTGNNQALFVIDGVPISNNITNSRAQEQAGTAYDYGNAASDINPDDIESVNVLKGAAASALYGSRAANGVVMITTKKGSKKRAKGFGVTVNSGITIGSIDKKTFPKYQKQYGGGYGPYYEEFDGDTDLAFWNYDIDGDGIRDQVVPLTEDASYGAAFDPNLMVYQWDAFDPESPNFGKKTSWIAAKNGPIEFFETPVAYTNTVSIDNGFENGSYRFSYTNFSQDGLLPNSSLDKNNFTFSGVLEVTDRLTATGFANFIRTEGLGRNTTGYSDNIMGSFRQWWQANIDVKQLKDAYFSTRRNVTWNYASHEDLNPIYWDNPYWRRYENYESDERNRTIANISLNYKVNDWLDVFGRVAVDTYGELQEERKAIGSIAGAFGIGEGSADGSIGRIDVGSGYQRKDITFSEYNYDVMLNFNKDITDLFSLRGILGLNVRRTNFRSILSATNGGLNVPRLYSLQNSKSALPLPREVESKVGVDGIYGSFSLGYDKFVFLDGTLRRDHSSTLPSDNSSYYYPSIAASFLFDRFIDRNWLTFGKVRLNYAEVGNGAPFDQVLDSYVIQTAFNGAITSVGNTKKNPNLKEERTKSIEAGLEMYFLDRRVGFDMALYKTNSKDQILPVRVTAGTGYLYKQVNSGEIQNKGIELSLTGTPIKNKDFSWDVIVNWSKNKSKVKSLIEGLDNLQLGSFQGGITLNATVGQPYGVLYGTDYTYLDGQRVVDPDDGQYIKTSTSDNVIGDVNPDWTGGIRNSFSYKDFTLSFLIDIQKGGDIFSLDMYYGLATGLYKETAFINDLGNPVRNSLADGGGFINNGVNSNGSVNTTRIRADRFGALGYRRGLPDKAFIYDAGYVKLRELSITYKLPQTVLKNTFIKDVFFSVIGSNLWIIHKNLPHADPESGLGAGNLQGYSTGSLPTTRDFGFNIKVQF